MDCKSCKEARETISRQAHESDMDRMERINKRQFWAWMITIFLFLASWAGFIWYESQWEVVETQITQENESGYNNYIGNDGDIYNGEANSDNPEADS